MAGEILKSADGLLAGFPDNVSGQIAATDSRNFVISAITAIGHVEDDAGFTIPITSGVPTVINPIIPVTMVFTGNFFTLDGNNAFIPDYGSVIINPGTVRLVDAESFMVVTKSGSVAQYETQWRVGGVPIGTPITQEIQPTATSLILAEEEFVYDVDIGAPLDLQITGIGTNDDLQVFDIRQRVESQLI